MLHGSALTFLVEAAESMHSGGSLPNAAEADAADIAYHTEVEDSTATTNVHADAKNEGGAESTEANPSCIAAAVSGTQDTAETEAGQSGAAGVNSEAQDTAVIEESHSDAAVDKSQDTAPTAIIPAHSDRAAWPDWMNKHVAHVEAAAISDNFRSLVQQYIKLEASLGYPKGQVRGDGCLTMNRSY